MPILVTGNKSVVVFKLIRFKDALMCSSSSVRRVADAGFTLIEIMVVIAIMAIVLGAAVLALPNHDERYWKDNLNQLTSSLNLAQEESAMSGTPIIAQVDSAGWRFFVSGVNWVNVADVPNGVNGSSSLMPDVYRPQSWYKPVEIPPLQLTLGSEQVTQVLQIPVKQVTGASTQDVRQALLIRNRNGRFSWVKQ